MEIVDRIQGGDLDVGVHVVLHGRERVDADVIAGGAGYHRLLCRAAIHDRAGEGHGVAFLHIDTATAEIYTLSLHDALPICGDHRGHGADGARGPAAAGEADDGG